MYHAVFLVALSVLFLFSSDVCLLSATLQSAHARVVLWCDCVRVCAWMQYQAVLLVMLSVPFLFSSNLLLCCKVLMHALFYGVTVCGCACVFVSMRDGWLVRFLQFIMASGISMHHRLRMKAACSDPPNPTCALTLSTCQVRLICLPVLCLFILG